MSRRDKILSMAISQTHNPESHIFPSEAISQKPIPSPSHIKPTSVQERPVLTNLNELWLRPLDFNDFKPIFDFKNEYRNSYAYVQDYDLTLFNEKSSQTPVASHSIMCYETFPSSDEENDNMNRAINYFEDSDDSVKDKDYCPNFIDNDSDSPIININYNQTKLKRKNTRGKGDKRKERVCEETDRVETECEERVCEETDRVESKCEERVCEETDRIETEYEETDRVETECEETDRVETECEETHRVETECEERVCEETDRVENECEERVCEETDRIETECEEADRVESECEEIEHSGTQCEISKVEASVITENEKGLTKAGLPRKRRKFDVPLPERKRQKKEDAEEKLSLKPPCNDKCRKKCTTKISEDARREIHDRYVNLNWEARGVFIKGMVEPKEIKTRSTKADKNKRDVAYFYHFQVNNEKINVCKTYFLTTLGYNPQNNRHVHLALSKEIDDQVDKRGSYQRKNLIDKDIIKDHIQSFNPTISHYRREHAPNKLYLPSDISVTMMYQCFKDKHPSISISLETYRKVVKEMKISFAHLGHEECEQCALLELHTECSQENCDRCIQYRKHKLRYTESRGEYQRDKEQGATDKDCIYFSVDLQKIIMLPRMDQFKTAIFCPRIIAFNESFVPLGNSNSENVPYAVLWNETTSGRSQEDIISAFRSFFIHKRDMRHIVLWADNCAAQNKNWAFMCFLVNIVNSELIAAESITVKYFEPGHSFMSADNFHHQVESALKKKKKVYDFDDFVDSVKISNSKRNTVKVMTLSDFYCYEDLSSQHKIRNMEPRVYLKDIMAIRAERGTFTLKYKGNHVSDWQELDFLQVKIIKNKCFPNLSTKSSFRGITKERKNKIIADLVPLMPENRRSFWLNLPEASRPSNLD